MKKLFFAIAVISLLISCGENKFYTVSITNESSKEVSYTYNDVSDTLAIDETKTYEVPAYTPPPKDIADSRGVASLEIKKHSLKDEYTFTDATVLVLKVENYLTREITIRAGNYIDNEIEDSPEPTELTINVDEKSAEAKIYTTNPQFTETSDYPVIINWSIAGDEMRVTVR